MKTLLTTVALMFSLLCMAQKPQNDWNNESLKGKVKVVRFYFMTTSNLHDLSSPLPKMDSYFEDSFSALGYRVKAYQVKNGNRELVGRIEYKFNDNGYLEEVRRINRENMEDERTAYTYDETGNIIEQKRFLDNEAVQWISYSFVSGRLLKKEDSVEGCLTITIYKYDNQGRITQESHSSPSGKSKYIYDKKGNIILEEYKHIKIKWDYDEYNNRISQKEVYKSGERTNYIIKYSYDKHHNWLRRIEDEKDNLGMINGDTNQDYKLTVREIEYY